MSHRHPRIRVSGMVWHADRLLLVRQGRRSSPRWMLPGGGVEAGESLQRALLRELREEVKLAGCRIAEPVAMVESIAPPSNPSGRHLLHIVFEVVVEDEEEIGRVSALDPDVHEVRMFARPELLDVPIHPPIAGWLAEWKPGSSFSYFGQLWAP